MRRLFPILVLGMALAAPARGAEQNVTYKAGSDTASGFLVVPTGAGPFPAVVVIQEWWGLDNWVKDQARALGKEGYVALAVDLYRGKVTVKQEEAHQLMMGLSPDRALADLEGAVTYLAARTDV